jgi:hypothetical protein
MGHDVSFLQASGRDGGESREFDEDVEDVVGLLRRRPDASESAALEGGSDDDDGGLETDWQAAMSGALVAANQGRQEVEKLKTELEAKR